MKKYILLLSIAFISNCYADSVNICNYPHMGRNYKLIDEAKYIFIMGNITSLNGETDNISKYSITSAKVLKGKFEGELIVNAINHNRLNLVKEKIDAIEHGVHPWLLEPAKSGDFVYDKFEDCIPYFGFVLNDSIRYLVFLNENKTPLSIIPISMDSSIIDIISRKIKEDTSIENKVANFDNILNNSSFYENKIVTVCGVVEYPDDNEQYGKIYKSENDFRKKNNNFIFVSKNAISYMYNNGESFKEKGELEMIPINNEKKVKIIFWPHTRKMMF